MVNNFELITNLINVWEPKISKEYKTDTFYTLMIVQRQKDNIGIKVKEGSRKTYLIKNTEELYKNKEEIINLCETLRARAYINLSPKSLTKVQKELLLKLSEYNLNNVNRDPYRTLTGVIGETKSKNPKWVIDIDNVDRDRCVVLNWIQDQKCPMYTIIPTKSGIHIITVPFDSYLFEKTFPDIDLHKNSMGTVLYVPNSIDEEIKIKRNEDMQKWIITAECGGKTEESYFAYCKDSPLGNNSKHWNVIAEIKNLLYEDYYTKVEQECDADMEDSPSDDELWVMFENDLQIEAFQIEECENNLEIIIDEREK